MIVKKLIMKNFKRFEDQEFEFNNDVNIIVGDNESGKSTLLEAIELVLNCCYRGKPITTEISTSLFNDASVRKYLAGDLSVVSMPEILIEAYVEGAANLKGDNNTLNTDTEGLFLRICFDDGLEQAYQAFLDNQRAKEGSITTLPVEFYKHEWFGFSWDRLNRHSKKPSCLFVDAARLHPTFGRTKYIGNILNSELTKEARTTLNLNYRQLKAKFDAEEDVMKVNEGLDASNEITSKDLKITADIGVKNSWESSLQLAVDDVAFEQIGKGEQNQIQIKLALSNKSGEVDVVLVEEPENHLSHINLVKLIKSIEQRSEGKQVFMATHSSYVLNKLSADKLCLLSDKFQRFIDIDKGTVKTLKRLPGYDTLRVVLAQKIVLVEGPSDELLLKKIYLKKHGKLPEEDGIDIIVVRGIGFRNYLNIAKPLNHPVRVVKDNDGAYQKNIVDWFEEFKDGATIYSPLSDAQSSLEPALIEKNGSSIEKLDVLAKEMLSTQTYNKYLIEDGIELRKAFLLLWFKGEDKGARKVDSAIRIFDGSADIEFPEYLDEAIDFGE